MGLRRDRLDRRIADQIVSRRVNGVVKNKERERRRNRLIAKLKDGNLPYTPVIMSWLSAEINKPSRFITQEDVDGYLATANQSN
ncbi:MAG: hypothetical protein ACFCD0_22690 [Gemmataceae bacterium]